MPAPFVRDLCRYRSNGKPNTSDAHDALSVELGVAFFDLLDVPREAVADKDEPTGKVFADAVAMDLATAVPQGSNGVRVASEQPLNAFDQFRHVGGLRKIKPGPSKQFERTWKRLTTHIQRRATDKDQARVESLISEIEKVLEDEALALRLVLDEIGDESLLKLDVTVSRPNPYADLPLLETGLSLKWSLRTDRAQDCRSQGAKMSALRRGRMPHFAAVTMEPRPTMLNLLAGGSGDVDCVYCLDLPTLQVAVDDVYSRTNQRIRSRDMFRRLVDMRRIRDYDELVATVSVT